MYDPTRIRRIQKGIDDDEDRDSARYLVTELKKAIVSGAGDPQGTHGDRYRTPYNALLAVTERMGIAFSLPQDSLGAFVTANPSIVRAPSLLRDSIIDPPFERLLDNLDNPRALQIFVPIDMPATGWDKVDAEIAELRAAASAAATGHDRGAVGRLCREVFITLAEAAYDIERHGPLPEKRDGEGGGTVKDRLEQVIKAEAAGSEHADSAT